MLLRDELHGPTFTSPHAAGVAIAIEPRAFLDYGFGRDDAARLGVNEVSLGVGGDIRLGRLAVVSLDAAMPLRDARVTRAGTPQFDMRVSVAY